MVREALVERRWIADIQGALTSLALWQYVHLWRRVQDVSLSAAPETLSGLCPACLDCCWMGDRLARRGLPHLPLCPLCDQSEETMQNLLAGFPFSRSICYKVLLWIRSTAAPLVAEDDFVEWWLKAAKSTPGRCVRALRRPLCSWLGGN
jgi:hypothetical protein